MKAKRRKIKTHEHHGISIRENDRGTTASHRVQKVRAGLRETAGWMARSARLPHLGAARVVALVGVPDERRRDLHNLTPTLKPMIDGLVDAGVLDDDDVAHLVGPDLRHDLTPTRRGTCRFTLVLVGMDLPGQDPTL